VEGAAVKTKKQKLTPWFPAEVDPVRAGVYEVSQTGRISRAVWDGVRWKTDGFYGTDNLSWFFWGDKWRGLAEPPK
jgi:hypothetical protein